VERGRRVSIVEWPDAETAWRALASVGPAVPALEHSGPEVVRHAVLDAIEPCRDERGIYRFRNDHHYVVARKPGPRRGPSGTTIDSTTPVTSFTLEDGVAP
jgi:hypothetical protein